MSKYLPTSGTVGLVVSVVNPQPGERIMDACAAPGGKTLFMASCLKGQGNIAKAHCPYTHPLLYINVELSHLFEYIFCFT